MFMGGEEYRYRYYCDIIPFFCVCLKCSQYEFCDGKMFGWLLNYIQYYIYVYVYRCVLQICIYPSDNVHISGSITQTILYEHVGFRPRYEYTAY